jgi:hypothetical protein
MEARPLDMFPFHCTVHRDNAARWLSISSCRRTAGGASSSAASQYARDQLDFVAAVPAGAGNRALTYKASPGCLKAGNTARH